MSDFRVVIWRWQWCVVNALIMLCIAGLATVRALKLARASQSLRPESASMQTTIARTRPSSSPGATSTP